MIACLIGLFVKRVATIAVVADMPIALVVLNSEIKDVLWTHVAQPPRFRAERTSLRAGVAPAEVQRLSRRTISPATTVSINRKGMISVV